MVDSILEEIERKYPVETITENGWQLWPYLRVCFYFHMVEQLTKNNQKPGAAKARLLLRTMRNCGYGIKNWFGQCDYLVFSDTLELKNMHNLYTNRRINYILECLGEEKTLYVEIPRSKHYPQKCIKGRRIVSCSLLTLFAALLKRIRKCPVVHSNSVFEAIKQEYHLDSNYPNLLKSFFSQYTVLRLVYKIYRPKLVIVSDHYTNIVFVKAAKDAGIRVVEAQHGNIGENHFAYYSPLNLDPSYYPDFLLAMGENEQIWLKKHGLIKKVIPVGEYYLEYMTENFQENKNLAALITNYKYSVGISLQWTIEDETIAFINQCANLDENILYILIPREQLRNQRILNLPENIVFGNTFGGTTLNFQEIILHCSFHATVYSSCALEAPSLGKQNIMIDLHGLSREYFGKILAHSETTKFVETPEQFVQCVKTTEILAADRLKELNRNNFKPGYKNNIRAALKKILKEGNS